MTDTVSEKELEGLLTRCRQLSQRVHQHSRRYQGEWDAIREEIASMCQSLREAKKKVGNIEEAGSRAVAEGTLAECTQALRSGPGGDLTKHQRSVKKPVILGLLLGQHCPVHTVRKDEAFRIKEEYHSFRGRIAQCMLVLCALLVAAMRRARHVHHATRAPSEPAASLHDIVHCSFSPIVMVGVQVFLVFMIYFYMAMASRESVLLMNGSHIRSWWIWHHYVSAVVCIVTLALPVDSVSVQTFVEDWLMWSMFQAALMLAQNWYQRKRMYARIALGKDSALDVVGGESSGMQGQLLMLLPFLFILQGWQMWLGTKMMHHSARSLVAPEGWLEMERHETDLRGMRGTFLVGTMLAFMGVLNAANTISTIRNKRKVAKSQRTKKRR